MRQDLRCVADQVDELVQLYDKILRRQSRPLDDGRSDIAPGSIIGARRRVSNCPGLVATKPLTSPRPTERARGTVAQAPDPAERALIRASKAAGRLNMADV